MNGAENSKKLRNGCFQKDSKSSTQMKLKKVKREVTIDEVWPVFSLKEAEEDSVFNIEIPESLYQEYLWTAYKYHEFQLKLQVYYEQCHRAEFDSTQDTIRTDLQQNPSCIHGTS